MKKQVGMTISHLSGLAILTFLGGCLSSGDDDKAETNSTPISPPVNSAPTISGTPSGTVLIGNNWSFTPTASDPDGDKLTFSIENKPVWASFNTETGNLSGVPTLGNIGQYSDIRISVSDGSLSTSLSEFSIAVNQVSLGSITLSWTPPVENEDGSPLTDLAGYKFYYGFSSGNYTDSVYVDNPGISTYVIASLEQRRYFIVAAAMNSSSVESRLSGEVSIQVN